GFGQIQCQPIWSFNHYHTIIALSSLTRDVPVDDVLKNPSRIPSQWIPIAPAARLSILQHATGFYLQSCYCHADVYFLLGTLFVHEAICRRIPSAREAPWAESCPVA